MRVKSEEEQRMNKERSRVSRLETHFQKELRELESERHKMERERKAYVEEAREKEREAIRTRVECAQMIAQSKGNADSAVETMKTYIQDQERLRIEAEDQTREALKKSSFLADRNKLLSDKLSAVRKDLKRAKESGGESRKVKKDDDSDITLVKEEDGESSQDKGKTRQSPLRSSVFLHTDPSSQAQLEDDGFIVESYKPGPPKPKRARLSSERDDSAVYVIDSSLEEDFDDGNYPMPGFHHQHRHQQGDSSTSRRLDSDDEDDSVEIVGARRSSRRTSSRPEHILQPPTTNNILQRIYSGNLVLVPRQRAR